MRERELIRDAMHLKSFNRIQLFFTYIMVSHDMLVDGLLS